jgi:hypothetical protein
MCIWANKVLHIRGEGKKKQQKDKRNRQGAQNAIDLQSHAQMNPMNWFFMNSES